MAYSRVIVQGTFGGGEVWSVGVAYSYYASLFGGFNQAQCESIITRLITNIPTATWPASLRTLISSQGQIVGWRVETRQEDEKISAVAENAYASPIAGTGAHSKTPQDAIVISLRTTTPGARGRGRVYWPAIGASLDATFKLASPNSAAIANDAKTLLKLIGDQLTPSSPPTASWPRWNSLCALRRSTSATPLSGCRSATYSTRRGVDGMPSLRRTRRRVTHKMEQPRHPARACLQWPGDEYQAGRDPLRAPRL